MKNFIALLFALFIYSNSSAQWEFRGLDFTYTTDLTIYGDTNYASTYDGIYKQEVTSFSSPISWTPCGMQGRHVVQTFVPNYQTFICLVEIDSTTRTQIYKSIDGGNSFNLMTTDTSAPNNYPFLDAMAHPHGNYDTLYFLNHHLKTYDGGLTWDTLHFLPQNDRFITVNPTNGNHLIIGGETGILSPYLQVSYDKGNTWTFPAMNGYFAGDNSVHDIAFDYLGNWYAAGEGVICMSTDSGNNWTQLLNTWSGSPNFSLYNWDIETGTYALYVTGSNTNALQVPFIYINPFTMDLDTMCTPPIDSLNPEMKCISIAGAPFGEDVFIGGHGVYVFHVIIGKVTEHDSPEITLYPNPFIDKLNLYIKDSKNLSDCTLTIYNSTGQLISTNNHLENFTSIDLKNISKGIYFIQIADKNRNVVKSFRSIKF